MFTRAHQSEALCNIS